MIAGVTAPRVAAGLVTPASMTTVAHPPVLAPPADSTPEGLDDAMSMFYAMNQKLDTLDSKLSEQRAVSGAAAKKQELKNEQEALHKAEDALRKQQEESHSFLHQLAKSAGVVGKVLEGAAVGALLLSGVGTGLAVAVVALSVASEVASHVKGAAGTILGIACTLGEGVTAAMTGGTSALSTGLQAAGSIADGVGTGATALSQKAVADDGAEAVDADADAQAAERRMALRQALIDDAIAAIKDTHDAHQRTMGTIQTAMQTSDAIDVQVSNFGRV